MSETNKPPALFWVVGVIFLLWNLFGCYMYWLDQTMEQAKYVEAYGEGLAGMRDQIPVWATSGYAVGVFGGLLAAILFLLRKKLAYPVFVLSLIGAVVGFLYVFITPEYKAAAGSSYWIMPVIVLVVGIVEIWVSKRKIAKGILS